MSHGAATAANATRIDAMLRGVRAVNQIVAGEHDPDVLVQRAAEALAKTRGFAAVCIVRSASGGATRAAVAGDPKTADAVRRLVGGGGLTACLRRAIRDGETVVHPPAFDGCSACPLNQAWTARHDGVAVPIEHEGRRFGGLLAKLPDGATSDPDEIGLLREIAGDIALGLRGIKLDAALCENERRAEDALRESEARFRSIFEQAAVGVAQLESRTGRFVRVNQRYCDIAGRTREEMLACAAQDITHVDDFGADQEAVGRLLSGAATSYSRKKRYVRKDGELVWVELTVSRMWADGEEPRFHVEVAHDITARVHTEAALAEADERQRLALDAAEIGTWRHDFATGQIEIDERAQRHFGVTGACIPFKELCARIHPDDVGIVREAMRRSHGADGRVSSEHRVILPSGEVRWLSVYVQVRFCGEGPARRPRFAVATSRDITAQKLSEQRLVEHRESLRGLASRLEMAQEDERRRIAAGLHDDVGQLVVACQLKIGALRDAAPPGPSNADLDGVGALLQQASERIGQLTFELGATLRGPFETRQAAWGAFEHEQAELEERANAAPAPPASAATSSAPPSLDEPTASAPSRSRPTRRTKTKAPRAARRAARRRSAR